MNPEIQFRNSSSEKNTINEESIEKVVRVEAISEEERQNKAELKITRQQEDRDKIQLLREDLSRIFSGEDKQEEVNWIKLENNNFDENSFYRIVDEKGYEDFVKSGIVRSSPTGTDSNIVGRFDLGHRPTSFPSFDKGSPDFSYAKKGFDNYIFESDIPMYKRGEKDPTTESLIKGRHWAYRPIDEKRGGTINELTSDMIKNIYKLDKEGNIYKKEN